MNQGTYKMFPEEHFGIVKFAPGVVYMEEMFRLNSLYKNDKHYPDIYYLIIYAKACLPDAYDYSKILKLSDEYLIEPLTNNHICTVIIIDEPEATAFSHIFISLAESKGFYCLTLEKAYSILKIPITMERFMEMVQIGLNQ